MLFLILGGDLYRESTYTPGFTVYIENNLDSIGHLFLSANQRSIDLQF